MGTASLGMYDAPFVAPANDALWAAVAARLRAAGLADVPAALDRTRPLAAIWQAPDLLFAQTCGYPLVTTLRDVVRPVAAPIYRWPGCQGATHRSVVVVATGSPADGLAALIGARAAINGRDSNTGMNLFRRALADVAAGAPMFGEVIETGSHLASLAAVRDGEADAAAIDAVTFALATHHRPELTAGLRVVATTPVSPSLPFVTRRDAAPALVAALVEALAGAIADPVNAAATTALGLVAVQPVTFADYAVVRRYAEEAAALGYPALA
ncbi:phosphate/phosphite/phosphonate ABC transporter substrate-binding protein [Acuticoccus sp. I52.16.1]|uniref:phosphate/phosphite/phosphonate ABC transporter substrate-binding protein n=1 Tax=Acuticoccus sp. I52.16.1 TaxID=2928472 RepID=UPI001FD62608|nr:PhnD/SsuA/transferrin family substrate-binding protein [Acuticoccus sp. I52.16.1]UOM35257.1 PhnD/SsuA/transferrin family substrate-binding protein [Acuticoccus sp. I52.16.1]